MSSKVFSLQQARTESQRCLQCYDAPCIHACPVHIDIPVFISMIGSGNVRGAAEVIKTANAFANVCGRVCPEEVYCQSVCNRGKQDAPIAIRELHFFATSAEVRSGFTAVRTFKQGKTSVAVIGGGPAGLSCAFELMKLGHMATVFDGQRPGGVPRATIPSFRLENDVLQSDLVFLRQFLNIRELHVEGSTIEDFSKNYDAVFIAIGLGTDRPLGIPGEGLEGVLPVLPFLETAKWRGSKLNVGARAVVIGGGNVSLDAAATAKRMGAAEVTLVYRRGEREMRVWKSELEEARAQGVEIRFLTNPVRILGDTRVSGVECVRMKLSEMVDATGRPVPVAVPGSEHVLPADTVVVAIGQVIPPGVFPELARAEKGFLRVGPDFMTSRKGIFAGGDAINGEGTIVLSVGQGKAAARAIDAYFAQRLS